MLNEIVNCDDCQHVDLCKWCAEKERVQVAVRPIPDTKTPIQIAVTCNGYHRKARKQDGLNFHRGM